MSKDDSNVLPESATSSQPHRSLSVLDSTMIIVGTIIGSAIFMLPSPIANHVDSSWQFIGIWVFGAFLAFLGSLCYAELSTTYNADGGDYVYLRRSFGKYPAFLFAWTCGWIFRPANIAAMAVTFAIFFDGTFFQPLPYQLGPLVWSVTAVTLLTVINLFGLGTGKWTQNVLTFAKIGGLSLFILLALSGLFASSPSEVQQVTEPAVQTAETSSSWFPSSLLMALVFVMFTYGGWNDIAFVAGEVRSPKRNLPLSLFAGLTIVTTIYLLVNIGLLANLGLDGIRSQGNSTNVTIQVVQMRAAGWGLEDSLPFLFKLMVSVSCLGAIGAMLITSPRLYFAAAKDHFLFSKFGKWDKESQSPKIALIAQYIASIVLLFAVNGLAKSFLSKLGLSFGVFKADKPFDELVAVSSPFFWFFLSVVGITLIVLRLKDPQQPRPFKTWGFPVTPIIFSCSSFFMFWSSIQHVIGEQYYISASVVVSVFLIGVVAGFYPGKNTSIKDD